MNDVININERINAFLDNKTYIFIRLISGKFFNGFILSKKGENELEFEDDKLGKIPILINEIEIIDYSTKKIRGGQ